MLMLVTTGLSGLPISDVVVDVTQMFNRRMQRCAISSTASRIQEKRMGGGQKEIPVPILAQPQRPSTSTRTMPYQSESVLVFAAREAKKMWPFIAGFGVVGYGVTMATLGITEEDKKKSTFLNPGAHH